MLAYLGVVAAPLVFAAIGASDPGHSFWTNFSVALGFVGLAMMGLEFALVARFQAVAAPFGQDALLQFHRQIGYVGLAFVLVHSISVRWEALTFSDAIRAPALVWFDARDNETGQLAGLIAGALIERRMVEADTAPVGVNGPTLLDAVFGGLERAAQPVVLVLDDVHALASSDAVATLDTCWHGRPGTSTSW